MSDDAMAPGSIAWHDLTVPNAAALLGFYGAVVGWTATEVDMGGYADFCVNRPGDGTTVAGICNARGPNADIPPVWMIYVIVPDLDASLAACVARGGSVVKGPFEVGEARAAVIRDPAGAVLGLYQA
jgi:hypothetical protein